jgi:hypothetical protein
MGTACSTGGLHNVDHLRENINFSTMSIYFATDLDKDAVKFASNRIFQALILKLLGVFE